MNDGYFIKRKIEKHIDFEEFPIPHPRNKSVENHNSTKYTVIQIKKTAKFFTIHSTY